MPRTAHATLGWVVAGLALVAGCGTATPQEAAQKAFDRGNRYSAGRQYPEAIVEYRTAVQADPRRGDVRLKLAEAYDKVSDARSAAAQYINAADLLPADTALQLRVARLFLRDGRFQDAQTRAQSILDRDAGNVEAHIVSANAMVGLKDVSGAQQQLELAIAASPEDGRAQVALGHVTLAQGDSVAARTAFERAVALAPTLPEVHMALAEFELASGRLVEAEAPLRRAVALKPDHAGANRALATYFMLVGRAPEAGVLLERVVAATPAVDAKVALAAYYISQRRETDAQRILLDVTRDPAGLTIGTIQLAALDYALGRKAEAHQKVDSVLARSAKNVDALMLRARFLIAEGKLEESEKAARAAVDADPQVPMAHFILAGILKQRGDLPAAIEEFRAVVRLSPAAVTAQRQLAALLTRTGGDGTEAARQASRRLPVGNLEARATLARSLIRQGQLTEAASEVASLLKERPKAAEIRSLDGGLKLARGDHAGARRAFEQALSLNPALVEASRGLVAIELSRKNRAGARAIVDAQLTRTPEQNDALTFAATTYTAIGDLGPAEAVLRKLLAKDVNSFQAYLALARVFILQNRLDAAKAEFERAAAAEPRSSVPPMMLGVILEAQKKPAEARRMYEKALVNNPESALAANNLAWLLAEQGADLERAQQLAQNARRILPALPEIDDTVGWVFYKRKMTDMAIPAFRSAIDKDSGNAQYHFHLGLAHAQGGNNALAAASLDKALALKPDYREAKDARLALSR